ncbi:flavin-nucleotide-binding protein [Diaporthe amygdali]|uniref:flavin-nucleotide-binding protein n=1 Tax=Phomopsis amygdali TaxID=1214568 RepID=UPI0022FE9FAB|nr:flavin-nucleotide-binding protein [Diaporthe amygdali]KAJ0104430.1 flavin-nucleotide-binding protein [Diaporthe amygdali]
MSNADSHVYPKTADSSINRHKERDGIINSTPVAHVSFTPDPKDPKPVVLPMIARVGSFNDQEPAVYIHGYVSARMFRAQTGRPDGQPATGDSDEGFPVCIAATKIDNLVLALTPFNHSYDYRSAVVHGTATLLDPGTRASPANRDEIVYAMRLITDTMVANRYDNSREPEEAEIAATRILRVRIDSASAKIRDSGVSDDAKDLKNEETTSRVWTGVIPYVEVLGEPRPAATNKVTTIPSYIEEHVRGHNERAGGQTTAGGFVGKVLGSLFGR